MKLRNLLVSGALLLAGSAYAEVAERQVPVFDAAPIEASTDGITSMYMYNVGAKKFFCGGNSWGTQTSVGDQGYRVYFEQYQVDGAWDGTTVYFRDSCLAKSGKIMDVFFDNVNGGCFVDRGSQGNYWWKLEKNDGSLSYRLSMAEANPNYTDWQVAKDAEGRTYWGWDQNNGTVVSSFLPVSDTTHVDWTFHTVADYDAYQAKLTVYNAAQNLYSFLQSAWTAGVDVAAQEAVYANAASTVEEIDAAVVAVKAALAAYEESNVDPNNPVDKTNLLANPDYSDGKTAWSDTNSDWAVSFNVAEHYDDTFEHYQDLTGISRGVYAVTLRGYARPTSSGSAWNYYTAGTTPELFKLFAGTADEEYSTAMPNIWAGRSPEELGVGSVSTATDDDGAVWYVTNNMEGAEAYFGHEEYGPKYDATLFFAVDDDSVRIGCKQESKEGADWALWDNWRLTYYGNKAEAYQMLMENMLAGVPQYGDDVIATEGMIEEYNGVIAGLTATTYAELKAALEAKNAAVEKIEKNITLWQNFKDSVNYGLEVVAKGYVGDPVNELGDYVEFDAEDILAELALTSEELQAEMAKLSELIEAAKRCVLPGTDVTKDYIVNYNFEHATKGYGWNGSFTDVAGPAGNKCMEAYEKNPFDIYQIVENAPVGVYEISFNGFFRNGSNDVAYQEYQTLKAEGQTVAPQAWVYVNNHATPMKNCYDEEVLTGTLYSATEVYGPTPYVPGSDSTGYWYPNGMADAGTAFAQDMYKSSAYGIVVNKGDALRIGVKGNLGTSVWAIWDNFKMVFLGNDKNVIKPLLEEAIAAGKENLEKSITKNVYDVVSAAITAGEAVVGGEDGDAMFAALAGLYASNDSVSAVVTVLSEVLTAAEDLMNVAFTSGAGQDIIDGAIQYAGEIIAKIDGRELTTQQAEAAKKEIALWEIKLSLPDYSGASDENAIDFTGILKSADFGDYEGVNTTEGWEGATGSAGNDDTQKGAFAYEYWQKTFDQSQTVIGGLPNGTYRIEVSAFSRIGSYEEDYNALKTNPDTLSAARAVIYAWSTTDSLATYREQPVALGSSGLTVENLSDGSNEFTDAAGNVFYGPGSVVSASAWFAAGYYKNVLHVNVTDGSLCLGMKKTEAPTSSWVVMDSWKLFYLGTESKGIENVEIAPEGAVVSVAVYNVNGAQTEGLQKGLNIIRTVYANGAVTVKKVMVK